jgi:hypothetical protein
VDVAPGTIFVGGGTPSILADSELARLLAALPAAAELTVECNPETITQAKAQVLVEGGVTRVSLGAQSFRPHLLDVLERRARPAQISAAVAILRAAGIESLNLDLIFGVPGQADGDLRADLADLLVEVYDADARGDGARADELFRRVLPMLVFEIQQSIDHYNACAKRVLIRRGVLEHAALRPPAAPFGATSLALLERHLALLDLAGDGVRAGR